MKKQIKIQPIALIESLVINFNSSQISLNTSSLLYVFDSDYETLKN